MVTTTCVSLAVAFLLAAQHGGIPFGGQRAAFPLPDDDGGPEGQRHVLPATQGTSAGEPAKARPPQGRVYSALVPDRVELEPVASQPGTTRYMLEPGDTLVDLGGGVRIDLVFIPPGEFRMGSDDGQADEFPVRRVLIPRGFLIGKFEVTQSQWRTLMGRNPAATTGDDSLPVERVSFEDCQEFIRRLNAETGGGWRLPTEAEWEYACRAGTEDAYSVNPQLGAWHRENSGSRPHPVGARQPNRWGLYDMHGNVWEWCADWYDPSGYVRTNGTERVGPRSGVFRVTRGGSWYDDAGTSRSANRNGTKPDSRSVTLGFRLVRSDP